MRILLSFLFLLCFHAEAQLLINPYAFASAPASTLNNNLVGYWKLDEASGQRNDSSGTSHLTDNNTVTQAAGKVGNAAQFTRANSESLSVADPAALSMGDIDFTLAAWVYLDSTANSIMVLCKGDLGASTYEYMIRFSSSAVLFETRMGNGVVNLTRQATTFGAPSTATWYLIIAWHDATANTVNICVNNGTVDSSSLLTGSYDSAYSFVMGNSSAGTTYYWDGRIDEVGIWKRVLTAGERTELYNAGSGKTCCPF